ncbi:DUF4440 domain-containing protein [Spirosoma sp. HMF4905]|uniref:DUF4440 domain-containing protein n=1 Tax=Spirosoma arboris TaxID=2682092 RepID=A0A7K1SBK7_9BACT|nr:nuclear transport factor 2 family protein [Spirosoma arboris]MVM31179.1 DUF4440 domain-containing protein [Spirosoma arboris]
MNLIEQIEQAEQALIKAQLASDADTLDTLLADDLLFVGPDGELYDKAMDLASHRARTMYITSLVAHEPTIKSIDNLVIVSRKADIQGVFDGQEAGGQYRYFRVWANRQGRWQVIAGSITLVAGA